MLNKLTRMTKKDYGGGSRARARENTVGPVRSKSHQSATSDSLETDSISFVQTRPA
jgi:hypothetical protein